MKPLSHERGVRAALRAVARRLMAPTGPAHSPVTTRRPAAHPTSGGRVALVGAGPGEVELLTLRAARLLGEADAVVYDRLVGDDILELIRPGAERYYVGKACGHHSVSQAEIGTLMVRLAGEGRSVVRLKGGDPGVFGRMGEELVALAEAGIETDIVPGISAASGAAAAMGIPLTDRSCAQRLHLVTAHGCRPDQAPDWPSLARRDETLVFYMGLSRASEIAHSLMAAGLPADWPMMLIANASLPDQQALIGTLGDMPARLAETCLPSPCLIMVGRVVALAADSPVLRKAGVSNRDRSDAGA
ncbi:uroporphyrinogen-III C-methyltransferase [Kushneria sinocarnis]|nr:uroporphyrinogen-III C-methyltransferase [Kushneria sinocarnis]